MSEVRTGASASFGVRLIPPGPVTGPGLRECHQLSGAAASGQAGGEDRSALGLAQCASESLPLVHVNVGRLLQGVLIAWGPSFRASPLLTEDRGEVGGAWPGQAQRIPDWLRSGHPFLPLPQ